MVGRYYLGIVLVVIFAERPVSAAPVDYSRDVRPILSNRCFKCHGPATQKARLRLDRPNDAITAMKPDESEMLHRVTAEIEEDRMPPPEAGERLSKAEVEILRRWIESGAAYTQHWAFVPPPRPLLPPLPSTATIRNGIDVFVQARLQADGIMPSPEADRTTLIRRVSLDLIGLLPTPREVDDFVHDRSPNAYEKVVDRLLASPHYGERQARHWLDIARYADSNGFTVDSPRTMWPYRDWVIQAFNRDLPFDQFTIDQLAGDMLPNATSEQKIATGFHRNTPLNEEGGSDPEQFRVERTLDRANTTGAVWLGLTVACAQCHDHKYDPFSQADYYRLYAFFNSCDEPTFPVGADPKLTQRINELTKKSADLKAQGKLEEGKKIDAEIRKLSSKTPATLILRERKEPRESFVHVRGDFLRKGDIVVPDYPSALKSLVKESESSKSSQRNRLDLARWLVSPENPLTARVTVNREWQKFFGLGLVETENDFGMQGTLPTHPELLDWLAVVFRQDLGWSMKNLHRLIVTSATYRQSSTIRPELHDRDPRNRWLTRQNRLRLEAEVIRDAALSASGVFYPKIGGVPVYPPQPAEVFSFTQSKRTWPESKAPDRFRRGIYTFIWRQAQHPLLTTFDAADAQTTCTRRNRSTTPLQALHLANDPAFVELADKLGERIVNEGPEDDAGKIDYGFQLALTRSPSPAERERLQAFLESQRQAEPKTAWARLARVLLNLDEFITRE